MVQDITEPHVRRWRKGPLDAGTGEVTVAKAYRLLKAILNTAVDDALSSPEVSGAGRARGADALTSG